LNARKACLGALFLIICLFISHDIFSSSGIVVPSHDAIPRRPLSHYHSFYEDPSDWTPFVSAIRATPVYPRGGGLFFRDDQPHDIMPLQPLGVTSTAPLTHLLGKEIIDGEAHRWTTAPFITPLECHGYQLEWTRYVLMREETLLRRAGIYDSVFLSMFHYHIDTPWLRAFCERWNYSTNTLFIDDRELTPTLLEVQQLTGLPIFGHFYDEFMVSPADSGDFTRFPPSLQRTYEIYYHLRRGHPGVPFRHWIAYFTDRVHTRPTGLASTRDPFGTGRLEIYHDGPIPSQDTLCSHDVDRETYLTAFISWWICYFLLPSSPAYTIRPSVFVMASLIARGDRISLAVPVLANIYRCLRGLTSSRSPSQCQELIPWHLISGWLHLHWSGSYDPSMAVTLRDRLPLLSDLAGVQPASLTPEAARYRFFRSRDHLRFSRDRSVARGAARAVDRMVIDSRVPSSDSSSIRARPIDLEYLISIRQGFLPLRLGSYMFIEPYSPHRCAHQFGLDQDIPAPLLRLISLAAD
jgi:Plant mobile domain